MRNPRTFIGVVVTVVWAALYLRSILDPHFQPSPEVSPVMLVIVAWLFATDARRKRNGDGSEK